jgi:hypothetical protein
VKERTTRTAGGLAAILTMALLSGCGAGIVWLRPFYSRPVGMARPTSPEHCLSEPRFTGRLCPGRTSRGRTSEEPTYRERA